MARGTVTFDRDICKGCGLCIAVCPEHMIAIDEAAINKLGYHPADVIVGTEDDCIACVRCVDMCPDCGITLIKADNPRPSRS